MNTKSAPKEPLSIQQKEKLSELTSQSWNLELVISGAALFAVLQLPDVLDQIGQYVYYNLILQTTGMVGVFPLLVSSTMKVSCYVLFMAFLANFIMRAFWVGMVGLLAVYPEGIRYERIPFLSRKAQLEVERDFGTLDDYIIALDRRCNIVFALAFMFVLFLIVIAAGYLTILLAYSGLRPHLSDSSWSAVKMGCTILIAMYLLASVIISLPGLKNDPRIFATSKFVATGNKLIFMGLHRPFNYIINTFYSYIPYQKMIRMTLLVNIVFFGLLVIEISFDSSKSGGRNLFTLSNRALFSDQADSLIVASSAYDDQRAEDELVPGASIQSDVITDPYIRLFIAYPKALDTLLSTSKTPVWPAGLSRKERAHREANWRLRQFNELIQVRVNDSLYRKPGLLFTMRGPLPQMGWQTVLLAENLKRGRNTLHITLRAGVKEKEVALRSIPFWYAPEP